MNSRQNYGPSGRPQNTSCANGTTNTQTVNFDQLEAISSLRDKYPCGYPIRPNFPDPSSTHHAFSIDVSIGGNGYSLSSSLSLMWALNERKNTLYRILIDALGNRTNEGLVEAGGTLSEIERIDQMLTDLTTGLHNIAVRNMHAVAGLSEPKRIKEPEEVEEYERQVMLEQIKAIIGG
ncbi:hypothetical protein [Fibrella forsythiae]|uniref:Uncharacterized protein n=1 Tax=Fibrella forsythiae TaxID=2817061 RepID=A0ABS3JBY7_9BACT|nr:hypothetical protein [Fibrella forsythiae]MBO0947515.1 hypothetical protein [Fibrella forsythiae]